MCSNYKTGRALQASNGGVTAPSTIGTSSNGEGPSYEGVNRAYRALSNEDAASDGGELSDTEGRSDVDGLSDIDISSDEDQASNDGTQSDGHSYIQHAQPGHPWINPLHIDPEAILVAQETLWAGFGRPIPFEHDT